MRLIILQTMFMVVPVMLFLNTADALEGKNYTARYLEGSRLLCNKDVDRDILLQSFHDIINLPIDTLRILRYKSNNTDNKELSILDIFNQYIKPNRPDKTIGPGFYDELKTDEVRYKIKNILYALKAGKNDQDNTITNKDWGENEWKTRIESLFDVVIPQKMENLICFEENLFNRSIYIRFNLSSDDELISFLDNNSRFLGPSIKYYNPLKDITVNRRLKNKWHPDLLLTFSGSTKTLWKRNERRTYHYVFGKQNDEQKIYIYLICISD